MTCALAAPPTTLLFCVFVQMQEAAQPTAGIREPLAERQAEQGMLGNQQQPHTQQLGHSHDMSGKHRHLQVGCGYHGRIVLEWDPVLYLTVEGVDMHRQCMQDLQ